MELDIILSFYNEERVLPEFLRRIRSIMARMVSEGAIAAYHLIFVDDASTDKSLVILEQEAHVGDITVVSFATNTGVAEGVLAGLSLSTAQAAIFMDCDLQDPPEVIPVMFEMWANNQSSVEIVHTRRTARRGESLIKRTITSIGYRMLNRGSYAQLEPEVGDFKLLSRRAINMLLENEEALPFTRGLVAQTRLPSATVDYQRHERFDGAEHTHFPVLARRTIRGHLNRSFIAFSDWPLKFLLKLGIAMFAISASYLFIVLIQKVTGLHEPGWPALMAGITLFGSFNMLGFGILGLYINVIFLETKQRSAYTVSRVISATPRSLPTSARWPDRVSRPQHPKSEA